MEKKTKSPILMKPRPLPHQLLPRNFHGNGYHAFKPIQSLLITPLFAFHRSPIATVVVIRESGGSAW